MLFIWTLMMQRCFSEVWMENLGFTYGNKKSHQTQKRQQQLLKINLKMSFMVCFSNCCYSLS